MILNVYIIRRNSPESRLLAHLGFDRDSLPVTEWRGRRRSRGGYGKSPIAWRVSGQANVEKLCTGIVRIIGGKPQGKRTPEEQGALERAQRTLAAFDSRARRAAATERATANRAPGLLELLRRLLPSASEKDLALAVGEIERTSPSTMSELRLVVNATLSGRPSAWDQARKEFVATMRHGHVTTGGEDGMDIRPDLANNRLQRTVRCAPLLNRSVRRRLP